MNYQSCLWVTLLTIQASKNAPDAYVDNHNLQSKSDTSAHLPWTPEEFPNPDLDQRTCRTHLNRFCDPDAVLKEDSEVRAVEEFLDRNRQIELSCEKQTETEKIFVAEVQIAVALVERMDLTRFAYGDDDKEMIAAEKFARHVHDTWGVGMQSSCGGTGSLLFLSKLDRAVYISHGQALDSILTQYRIDRIIQQMRPLLQQDQYGKAILKGLEEIDHFIEEGPASPNEGTGDTNFGIALFAGFVGLFALAARRHRKNKRQYAEVSSQLNRLDQQRAQALQGQYKAKSCPICLEDFQCTTTTPMKGSDGLAVKLLRCGHVFDESCWSEWVNTGQGQYDKCPICREDVKKNLPKTQENTTPRRDHFHASATQRIDLTIPRVNNELLTPRTTPTTATTGAATTSQQPVQEARSMRLFLNERNFRLNRLGTRYPNFIRPNQLRSWTSPAFTGPLARDPAFVNLDPQSQMHNNTRQSHGGSSGFGGGSSSGGGGGRW